jgi:catechol 2,3-dioxygenase-like lactoylglutathione lyase family enzyme
MNRGSSPHSGQRSRSSALAALALASLGLGCANAPTRAELRNEPAGSTEAPGITTHPARIAFVGRMISDLDKSLAYYEALGFTRDAGVDSSWHQDEQLNRLLGVRNVTSRTARLTVNSNVSGKPFTIYLHELRGIHRKSIAGYPPWEPGAGHFGLVVPDAPLLWSQLQARGWLHARSWGGKLIPFPGETRGALAYMTDPDGLDIEIINQHPATPAANGRPARPALAPGLSHVGLVILDSDKERAFYGGLLGGQLVESQSPWIKGDFTDSAVGGHGNILRFFNESFPEAADPNSRMHFELVEFQNRKKPVIPHHIYDITVGYVGFEVRNLDTLLRKAQTAGARVISSGGGAVRLKAGQRAVLLRDPDVGGFIELLESPPPA